MKRGKGSGSVGPLGPDIPGRPGACCRTASTTLIRSAFAVSEYLVIIICLTLEQGQPNVSTEHFCRTCTPSLCLPSLRVYARSISVLLLSSTEPLTTPSSPIRRRNLTTSTPARRANQSKTEGAATMTGYGLVSINLLATTEYIVQQQSQPHGVDGEWPDREMGLSETCWAFMFRTKVHKKQWGNLDLYDLFSDASKMI